MAIPLSSGQEPIFIRDSRNHIVFLHHRPEGDFYGFQFECNWDGEICYLFCETHKAFMEERFPGQDHKTMIETYKEYLADQAFYKHTHGDSQLHPSKKAIKLRRYDVTLTQDDWEGVSQH